MRGEPLHGNLAGARFLREARTAPRYRLYAIGDIHPGMVRADRGAGASVAGEIYAVSLAQLERLLAAEPPGLGLGVAESEDGERILAVFWVAAELPSNAIDISRFGGWRAYRAKR